MRKFSRIFIALRQVIPEKLRQARQSVRAAAQRLRRQQGHVQARDRRSPGVRGAAIGGIVMRRDQRQGEGLRLAGPGEGHPVVAALTTVVPRQSFHPSSQRFEIEQLVGVMRRQIPRPRRRRRAKLDARRGRHVSPEGRRQGEGADPA